MPRGEKGKFKIALQYQARITILRAWARDGIPFRTDVDGNYIRDSRGELELEYFPRNISNLHNWTARNNSPRLAYVDYSFADLTHQLSELTSFSRNNNYATCHELLVDAADSAIKALLICASHQINSIDKTNIIEKQAARIKQLEAIVASQELECREARLAVTATNESRNKQDRLYKSNIEQLLSDIERYKFQISELTKSARKVTAIRNISTEQS